MFTSYLRFDLSTLKNNIDSAKIHLYSLDTGSETGIFQAQLVSNNTWGEMTININNRPAGSTVLGSWSDGGGDIVIDVTDALLETLGTGNKLSIRIVSMVENASIPKYGSRENANPVARPQLRIHYAWESKVSGTFLGGHFGGSSHHEGTNSTKQ